MEDLRHRSVAVGGKVKARLQDGFDDGDPLIGQLHRGLDPDVVLGQS
jgi:hypothetical protein